MNDEDRPLIDRQSAKSAIDLVTQGGRMLAVRLRLGIDGKQRNLERGPPPLATRGPVAGPDEDAVHPRVEAIRVPEAAKIEPGRDERVLYGVVGTVRVTDDQPRESDETLDGACGELGEGVMVAFPGPDDEVSLHGPCLVDAATRPRSASMGSPRRRSVPSPSSAPVAAEISTSSWDRNA